MSVVLIASEQGLVARPPTWRERLRAKVHARRLDVQLARGACPETSPELSLRAQTLVRSEQQRQLARWVAWAMDASTAPPTRSFSAAVPVRRGSVRAAQDLLLRLLGQLERPGPLPVEGVARVRALFTDGAGPLYHPGCPVSLAAAVQEALEGLSPSAAR